MAIGRGDLTRERILDAAQASVLEKGFGATSIEEIIAATGLTKSGFFYHFRDKGELAKALLHRYVETAEALLDEVFGRARALSDDPLGGFLLGLRLLAERVANLPHGHPGCLVAASVYAERLHDRAVRDIHRDAALLWRRRYRALLEEVAAAHPPREPVDLDQLADTVSAVLEGGIVLAKALREPDVLERQVLMLRSFVKLLFTPAQPAGFGVAA